MVTISVGAALGARSVARSSDFTAALAADAVAPLSAGTGAAVQDPRVGVDAGRDGDDFIDASAWTFALAADTDQPSVAQTLTAPDAAIEPAAATAPVAAPEPVRAPTPTKAPVVATPVPASTPAPVAAAQPSCPATWFCYPRLGIAGAIVPYTDCSGSTDVGTAIRSYDCLSHYYLMGHAYTQFGLVRQWAAGDTVFAWGQRFTVSGATTQQSCAAPSFPLAPLSMQTSLTSSACGAVLVVQAR